MYKTVEEYLSNKTIPYKLSSDSKEVQIQCLFCEDKKKHLYIHNVEGCWMCQRCGMKGSWKNLIENIGDNDNPQLESQKDKNPVEHKAKLITTKLDASVIEKQTEQIPSRIMKYLTGEERNLIKETIKKFQLGWDEKKRNITIPVFDEKDNLVNIRHRRDPAKSSGTKMWNEKGGKAAIFNIQALLDKPDFVVVSEGEFDAMIAEQNGFPTVTGTAGASTFKKDWVDLFDGIETIYICYDTDKAGIKGAREAAKLFDKRAKIVTLPSEGKEKVDITDYFGKFGHTKEDFQKLLDNAEDYKGEKFELVDSVETANIHPSLDYAGNNLYLSVRTPVKHDGKTKTMPVLISSKKEIGVIEKHKVYLGDNIIKTRKVASIPNIKSRWKSQLIQQYQSNDKPVSKALAFIEIKQVLSRFVDYNSQFDADILTLWLMGSYCFPIFEAFPYVYLVGVKRSGKTKTLLLIDKLAFNAILSSNISPAVLFRLVEATRGTLALDESEQLSDKSQKEELRELLNSGYKKGAPAYRITKGGKGQMKIDAFEIYSPKAIANIKGLDNVLEDRAITITMVRTKNPDKGNLAVTEASEDWEYLRSLLYEFALTYAKDISDIYEADPSVNTLLNRQNELWKPLLSIAKVVDQELEGTFEQMRQEALRKAEEATNYDLEDFDEAVLLALNDLSAGEDETTLTNKEIKIKAHSFLEEDQKIYLTSRGVGAALKRFGIAGKKIQGNWRYTVKKKQLEELFSRYGVNTLVTFK